MATLRPLLSKEHRGSELRVDIPGDNGRFVIDSSGKLILKGVKVVSRDPKSGKPNAFSSMDRVQLQRFAERIAPVQTLAVSTVAQTDKTEWFMESPVICSEIEVSALKCVLLTFDHVLSGSQESFTRLSCLADVRRFVRDAVQSGVVSLPELGRFSLGIQYEALYLLKHLRDQCLPPAGPFEHTMVVTGNAATRALDAIWWVLGIDPMGFRLSDCWDGPEFTCLFASNIMQGGGLVGPHVRTEAVSLCKPTDYRTFSPKSLTQEQMCEYVKTVSAHRHEGYRRAVALIETEADEFVRGALIRSAILGEGGDHSIEAAVRKRFDRLYREQITRLGNMRLVNQKVERELRKLTPLNRAASAVTECDASRVDWTRWLSAYRRILRDLQSELGMPGHVFANSISVSAQQTGRHQIGEDNHRF